MQKNVSDHRCPVRSSFAFCLFCLAAVTWTGAFAGPLPSRPGWRAETFRFPLAFAPSVPFDGTQDVRFAPGFARFGTSEGFTHAILWDIRPEPMEGAQLERALAVYFDGLMDNAARGRKLTELPVPAAVSLHPMSAPAGWSDAYAGTVHTWNAFSHGEEMKLDVEASTRRCAPGHLQVFIAMSMAPRRDKVWEGLRWMREEVTCEAPAAAPPAPPR